MDTAADLSYLENFKIVSKDNDLGIVANDNSISFGGLQNY
jgi:hypothetical protein